MNSSSAGPHAPSGMQQTYPTAPSHETSLKCPSVAVHPVMNLHVPPKFWQATSPWVAPPAPPAPGFPPAPPAACVPPVAFAPPVAPAPPVPRPAAPLVPPPAAPLVPPPPAPPVPCPAAPAVPPPAAPPVPPAAAPPVPCPAAPPVARSPAVPVLPPVPAVDGELALLPHAAAAMVDAKNVNASKVDLFIVCGARGSNGEATRDCFSPPPKRRGDRAIVVSDF
jgi:hypothetical protein